MAKTKQLGAVEPEFNEKLVQYANLIGMAKTDLLKELFYKEISDKVLNNDFIAIEKPYYINFVELQKNKTVKATIERPTTNLNETFIVKRIVNNLDSFNKENRTYCFNNVPEEHLGIYSYNKIVINKAKVNDSQVFQYYLLFKYNSGTEELTIELTSVEDVYLMLDVAEVEDVISELAEFNKHFTEAIDRVKKAPEGTSFIDVLTSDNNYINLGSYLTSILVIEPLSHAKSFSYGFLKKDLEFYEKLTENSKTSDLILIKDIVEDKENNTVKLITFNDNEGSVNNG